MEISSYFIFNTDRLQLRVSVMKICNVISFGAKLNDKGNEVLRSTKILAGYKDYNRPDKEYCNILKNSLRIIDEYNPQSKLDIEVENNSKRPYYIVKENDKIIYRHSGGDDFEFIKDFAIAIAHDKLIKN